MDSTWLTYIKQEFQDNLDLYAEIHFDNRSGYTASRDLLPLMKGQLLNHIKHVLRESYRGYQYSVTTRADTDYKNCYFIVVSIHQLV